MAPVLYRAWAELRGRWRAWGALAIVLGLFGGAVMAIAAGARRTDSAYQRFLVASHAWDVEVPHFPASFAAAFAQVDLNKVEHLPEVSEALRIHLFQAFNGPVEDVVGSSDPRFLSQFPKPKVLSGRLPLADRINEVALNFAFAEATRLRVGGHLRLMFPTVDSDLSNPMLIPVTFTVVGIEAAPGEFPPSLGNAPGVLVGPAFVAKYVDRILSFEGSVIRLKRGSADLASFKRQLDPLGGDKVVFLFRQIDQAANIERSFHLQALALWVLAAITGLVVLLVFTQTLVRQTSLESVEFPALRSLGMTTTDLVGVAMIRAAALALVALVVAAATAIMASPLFPRGLARIAEPTPGFVADFTVIGVGAVAILALTGMGQWIPAWRAARATKYAETGAALTGRARPSFADRLGRAGMPASGVAGVRLALEPGRGRTAVPVRSSIGGVTVGLAALVAALVFGTSLNYLLRTPRLYGVTWTLEMSGEFDTNQAEKEILPVVIRDPRVAGAAAGSLSVPMEVEGIRADAVAIAGDSSSVFPPLLQGRRPVAAAEVALGVKTLQRIGKHVGDRARMNVAGTRPTAVRIVGAAVIPPIGDIGRFGEGAIVPYDLLFRLIREASPPSDIFVRLRPGTDQNAFISDMRHRFGPSVQIGHPQRPADLVNFGRVQEMPAILAGMLGLLAAATLAHMLVTSILRRRRDLAILKTIGFVRGQVAAAVAWQASTLALLALLVGLPLGLAAGRWTWTAFAHQFGILPESTVSVSTLLLAIPATVLLANLLAAVPGRIAARMQPAQVLRTE